MPLIIEGVNVQVETIELLDKIKSIGKSVVLNFSEEGCPNCENLKSELAKVEPDYDLLVFEVVKPQGRVDKFTHFREKFNIKSYPTVVIVNSRLEKVDEMVGWRNGRILKEFFNKYRKGLGEMEKVPSI